MKKSKLQVLKSAAGYYIGRLYFDKDARAWFPYSRDSEEYFRTEEEAQKAFEEGKYTPRWGA